MTKVIFSDHAELRRKQKGLAPFDVITALTYPIKTIKRKDELIEIIGRCRYKKITVVYKKEENYLKIITII